MSWHDQDMGAVAQMLATIRSAALTTIVLGHSGPSSLLVDNDWHDSWSALDDVLVNLAESRPHLRVLLAFSYCRNEPDESSIEPLIEDHLFFFASRDGAVQIVSCSDSELMHG